jgi:hypothetical protein
MVLGLCTTSLLFENLKTVEFRIGRTLLKKSKVFLQNLDDKKTLRMQSTFLKSVENWSFESKITKIQVSDSILNISAILFQKPKLICIDFFFLRKPLEGVSVEFLFRKNLHDDLRFWPLFLMFLQPFIFTFQL